MARSVAGTCPSWSGLALVNFTVQRASRSLWRSLAGLDFHSAGMRPAGTVKNFVCGRKVEHQPAKALVKRLPKITANWVLAMAHSRGGMIHSFSERFKT